MRPSHTLGRIRVSFAGDHAVTSAGRVLPAALAGRLGFFDLVDRTVDLGVGPGASNAGAKASTVAFAVMAGACCMDDRNAR